MSWLSELFKRDTTPYPLEGETIEQCRRRLGLAVNQNPMLRPGSVRPLPSIPPPAPPSADAERQRLIKALGQAVRQQRATEKELKRCRRLNAKLASNARALRDKWPKIYREFFPFEAKE